MRLNDLFEPTNYYFITVILDGQKLLFNGGGGVVTVPEDNLIFKQIG